MNEFNNSNNENSQYNTFGQNADKSDLEGPIVFEGKAENTDEQTQNVQNNSNTENKVEEKGFSIASLVCGILTILSSCCGIFNVILGIFAIILGIIGKSIGGKGYAIAGIVCGAIGIVISIMITAGFLSLFKFIQTYV
ncbi:MAG: DUF4190 domain-containing protein [Clostridia bacterium]|nr:DUF4190 domain-containing protein [Clostridia bacterium]